ncbi:EcsC family protein [Laceyella sacchari]|nr:EcsC family protein [Laceyella sacchari]
MQKSPTVLQWAAKSIQDKINEKIPQKVHDVITESIKHLVRTVLVGSEWTTKSAATADSLEEKEKQVLEKIKMYKYTATVEGAGTGMGGLLLGLADFPMLLSIKMKFLFDAASLYGFDVKDYRERLYILHIFQLAFSSGEVRIETFHKMKNWQETIRAYPSHADYLNQLDWQKFQQTYRDHIDLAKMLQLVPGLGAVVGAAANYQFLDELGRAAMNAYRMRILPLPR